MISVSTNPIPFSISSTAFIQKFSTISFIQQLLKGKNTVALPSNEHVRFLLKRVAIFELKLDKDQGEQWIQWVSTSAMSFQTAIRFEYLEENSISIHIQTDTNVFMELFLEKRIKKMVETIVANLSVTIA